MSELPNPRAGTFVGGRTGAWRVVSQRTLSGPPIEAAGFVDLISGGPSAHPEGVLWAFSGVTTNDRYTTRAEKDLLVSKQAPVGRPNATCAALLLLRKNARWWAMTQDERRSVLEEESRHIAIGMRYLPAVARRLYHCRDLEIDAPFDFLGLLDFAPNDADRFDEMLALLRATREWTFMDREIDIRLGRDKRAAAE